MADYTFAESGPNVVRYEVRCMRCGECYSEVHMAVSPDFVAALDPTPPPPADRTEAPHGPRVRAWFTDARERSSAFVRDHRRPSHSGSDSN